MYPNFFTFRSSTSFKDPQRLCETIFKYSFISQCNLSHVLNDSSSKKKESTKRIDRCRGQPSLNQYQFVCSSKVFIAFGNSINIRVQFLSKLDNQCLHNRIKNLDYCSITGKEWTVFIAFYQITGEYCDFTARK